ncbi:DHH family phosphoesterase [Metamycoplasma neophronis]|uniref:GGDEF domain-containing protein n=1 Tax=Metamycoplasma neophronis TaxID=872983 RepID=A0ABY2Z0G8_9BACT|nr:DHH family phosphoesterase [Metamycoplasma neophronis]TPR54270.1 hypothetical protein FJR74_00615 [Metamycoplasma neophronis]
MNNKKNRRIYLILEIVFLFLLPTILFFVGIFKLNWSGQIAVAVLYTLFIGGLAIYIAILLTNYLKTAAVAKNSLNYYVQNEIGQYGSGFIFFLNTGKIILASNFVESRFGKKIIGQNIRDVFNVKEWTNNNLDFNFSKDNFEYEVHVSFERNMAVIKDITTQTNLLNDYKRQRIVFGELNVDNINLYQVFLSQEEIFKLYAGIVNVLDDLAKKYNLIYRQYENGRFFLITNQETLEIFETDSFSFFANIKNKLVIKDISVTLSAGFAYGIYKHDTLDQMAKEALLQSQTRGGDQITVMTKNEKPRHYGSSSEIDVNLSRTNVNYISKLLISRLKSKQISKVIIYGHKNADLDALGSTMGIYALSKGFGKRPYIQNETFDDTTNRIIKTLPKEEQEIFISPKEAQALQDEKTMVVICDTSDENRIENTAPFKNIKKENVFVLDHHRISKNPDFAFRENLYIDSSASSASEIVTEVIALTNNRDKINEQVAQFLLNGIYLDTNTFQKQTSAKTFAAASLLQEWGAKILTSVNTLKMNEEIFKTVKELLENLQEVKPGYYLAYKDIEASTDIISIAADEILRVNGRKAAFVVAKLPGTKICKMSARGINTNVQIIAEAVNGGGHFGAAAAESNESLDLFVDNIKQAIVSVKDESNIN